MAKLKTLTVSSGIPYETPEIRLIALGSDVIKMSGELEFEDNDFLGFDEIVVIGR